MEDFDHPDGSQFAISSNPCAPSESPRPSKRPRTAPVSRYEQRPPLSQISPSKPPRPQTVNPVISFLFSDSEDLAFEPSPPSKSRIRGVPHNLSTTKEMGQSLAFSSSPSFLNSAHRLSSSNTPSERVRPENASRDAPISLQQRSRLVQAEVQKLLAAPQKQLDTLAHIPEDLEVPSPPSSLSGESDLDSPAIHSPSKHPAADEEAQPATNLASSMNDAAMKRDIFVDTSDPPVASQDSAYFSFSRNPSQPQNSAQHQSVGVSSPAAQPVAESNEEEPQADDNERIPYYMRTFDYVVAQVLSRNSHVLRHEDIQIAHLCRNALSRNAYALFVRIYRRKQPRWYHVKGLDESYGKWIQVRDAVTELVKNGLLLSSVHAEKSGPRVQMLLAKELVGYFRLRDLKTVLRVISLSDPIRKMSHRELVPAFRKLLSEDTHQRRNGQKYRQATLSGLSQADVLARAILKQAGHSVKLPESVLTSLRRIHFLFFLEDGYDSPNVILADTGKAKFPDYECDPKNSVFRSSLVYEGYEAALNLEERLSNAIELKDYVRAADIGAIAELEIREFLECKKGMKDCRIKMHTGSQGRLAADVDSFCSTGRAQYDSKRLSLQNMEYRKDVIEQLRHPFFRRFSAQWVYVRVAWHSVQALERLEEYDNAIQRMKLLLSTGLVPGRRGKVLNRLTINLFKHQGNMRQALDIILEALSPSAPKLHLGDRTGLVKRGLNIHRKLVLPTCEEEASTVATRKAERKKIVAEAIVAQRPAAFVQAIESSSAKVDVRKIYGKSLQIARRELRRSAAKNRTDPWNKFMNEDSRESLASVTPTDTSVMGKSVYRSLGSKRKEVSVEAYCLQWYLGKDGWLGVHDEGSSLRFLFSLLLWEHALFAPVDDVFQTPYQDKPLDLFTEAFYSSRKEAIEERLDAISALDANELRDEVLERYERHELTRAIGCYWKSMSAEDLSCIAAGLGGRVMAHCCRLLCEDFAYWGGGLPDLTLWRVSSVPGSQKYHTKLVEVKSARDNLSEKQRAWLIELRGQGADCEVCKVVEKVTARNADELGEASLDSIAIGAIDAAEADEDVNAEKEDG